MGIRWPVFAIPWAISGGLRRWLRVVLSVVIETNTISLSYIQQPSYDRLNDKLERLLKDALIQKALVQARN